MITSLLALASLGGSGAQARIGRGGAVVARARLGANGASRHTNKHHYSPLERQVASITEAARKLQWEGGYEFTLVGNNGQPTTTYPLAHCEGM